MSALAFREQGSQPRASRDAQDVEEVPVALVGHPTQPALEAPTLVQMVALGEAAMDPAVRPGSGGAAFRDVGGVARSAAVPTGAATASFQPAAAVVLVLAHAERSPWPAYRIRMAFRSANPRGRRSPKCSSSRCGYGRGPRSGSHGWFRSYWDFGGGIHFSQSLNAFNDRTDRPVRASG